MLVTNLILVRVAGTDGVAIYVTGWRVATIAILPLLGIATAVVSVSAAAYGQGAFKKINIAFVHALKVGVIIEVVAGIAIFLLAPQITAMFTRAQGASRIASDLIVFLRIMCFFYPAVAFGMFSSSMFQGVGKGMNALIVTIIRTVLLTLLFTMLFAFVLGMGLMGVWFGIVMGNTIGAAVAFLWARAYIAKLATTMGKVETPAVAPSDS
jgi:Na+-driven multidrug efflux pump